VPQKYGGFYELHVVKFRSVNIAMLNFLFLERSLTTVMATHWLDIATTRRQMGVAALDMQLREISAIELHR